MTRWSRLPWAGGDFGKALRGDGVGLSDPAAYLVVNLVRRAQLQVVHKAARRRLDDLLPARRGVAVAQSDGQDERGVAGAEVAVGHPGPGEGDAAAKADLALADAQLDRAESLDGLPQSVKDRPRGFVAGGEGWERVAY